ncbi:MAG: hypothetical protein QOD44_3532 [Solirubrobacteraceae bacterium]|nr:hypothetical protein [Solirubrobacteraceae bacterium]
MPVSQPPADHPRTIGWIGTTALAMGGSNQSLFLLGALLLAQGTAAVPLLIVGLLMSWAAAPGWVELIMMWPKRVGGIAATCAEAFRPYSPVLANLTGVCYWWGWVPTCGLTAMLSAAALREWYLPSVPLIPLAIALVLLFTGVNLAGVKWTTRVAVPVAFGSALLALLSSVIPVIAGTVDWHRATTFHLEVPFSGAFGAVTSAMAGLYLIGFAAPAFEAATCHVGETKDPERNVPRAVFASGAMAGLFFLVIPVVWLGALGPKPLEGELMTGLGPTFAPLLAGGAKAAAIWFMVLNMFHGTLQPLAGAARTLSQLADDGLLPRVFSRRSSRDVPWFATSLTAAMAIGFLLLGDPVWLIAAANLCYLIGIALPSVAVWLLRRNHPDWHRPYRAPRGTIILGVVAAAGWLASTVLGFEQYGLPTVLASLVLAYAGSALYAWRRYDDRRRTGARSSRRSLHFKLTGAMVAVMALDGAGYLLAVAHVADGQAELVTVLSDIFVAVALVTIAVGLVLPGMISHAAEQVAEAATRLATGTVTDLTRAMRALARGDLEAAHATVSGEPVIVRTRDEMRTMADGYNALQSEVSNAALALDTAREGLRATESKLERNLAQQAAIARLGRLALEGGPIDGLAREITAVMRDVLSVDLTTLFEFEPASGDARLRAASGLGWEDARIRIPAQADIEGPLRERRPILVHDWESDAPYAMPAAFEDAGIRSSAGIAVAGHGAPFGVLSVHTRQVRAFAADELDFLAATGHVLAEAMARVTVEEDIRHRALHDPLTGLPNRVLFSDRLRLALAQAARRDTSVAVLFLDLDDFKLINDSQGHSAGDDLLRALGERLDRSMRGGDTVARFGGDEFVLICEGLNNAGEAVRIAERTLRALEAPFAVGAGEHYVSASLGIAIADGPGRDAEDLIREADAAMYRAKERGTGRLEVFDERMRAQATARLRIETELRRALEREELVLHYQPVVDIEDGGVTSLEALVRWQHPERGLLAPGEFIPVAEQSDAIVAIGEWVFEEACRQSVAWSAERPDRAPVPISVNLSARQVLQPDVVDRLAAILERTGADPRLMRAEITESALMEDAATTVATLERMKEMGLELMLDDFGTGYSSLAYVNRFPIDVLKIDRSFVAALDRGEDAQAIVEAIISMARGLRVDVIAEGVEDAEQAGILRALGCRRVQGFLYARPMPPEDVAPLLDGVLTPA